MTFRVFHFISFIIVCLYSGSGYLRAQGYTMDRASYQHYSMEDGLPHREVLSTVIDTNGLRWLSTADGLVRYDGYKFQSFRDSKHLLSNHLKIGADGLIYSHHPEIIDSVKIFNPYDLSSRSLRLKKAQSSGPITTIHRAGQPLYWLDGSTIYSLEVPVEASSPITPKAIHSIIAPAAAHDVLIHADTAGYTIFNTAKRTVKIFANGCRTVIYTPAREALTPPIVDRGGKIWYLTQDGPYWWRPGQTAFTKVPASILPTGLYNTLELDEAGNLIIGYLKPFFLRYEKLGLLTETGYHDLSWIIDLDDRIISFSGIDFRGGISVATHGGFLQISFRNPKDQLFERFMYAPETNPSAFGHVIRGFANDKDGNLYLNKDSRKNAWYRVAAASNEVDTILIRDAEGKEIEQFGCGTNILPFEEYLYGHSCFRSNDSTRSQLYRFDPSTEGWEVFPLPLEGHIIRYLVKDPSGTGLLLFTQNNLSQESGEIFRFDHKQGTFDQIKKATAKDRFVGYPRKVLFDDRRGLYWIGSTGGLYSYDPQEHTIKSYPFEGNPLSVLELIHAANGNILVGTRGAGLLEFTPDSMAFSVIGGTQAPGQRRPKIDFIILPSNDVAGLMYTVDGALIITTYNGLVIHENGSSNLYTVKNGLGSNEFNTASLHYDAHNNSYYAGGVNGFVRFRSENLIPDVSPYRPIYLHYRELDENIGIESLRDLPAHPAQPLVIQPSVVYFSLDFTLPDFEGSSPVLYETKLEGFDPAWRTPIGSPTIRYTRLPAGKYKFHLRAIDGSRRITQPLKPVLLTVLKPWHQKISFYVLCTILVIGIISGYIYMRLRQLKERLRTSEKLKDLKLRTLRQQMNPHFISNSMNAIREFIYQEEPEKAAGYLTDFSRLMRLFLEASRIPLTSIADEVKLLELYIKLEQLRFPGKFEFTIDVGAEIEPEMEEIPSFLLQPIVENAINHGLVPLETSGNLWVSFKLDTDGDTIICRIADDGIGRAAASKKEVGRTSRATEILQDRESILREDKTMQFSMETTDLCEENYRPGTLVVITLSGGPTA